MLRKRCRGESAAASDAQLAAEHFQLTCRSLMNIFVYLSVTVLISGSFMALHLLTILSSISVKLQMCVTVRSYRAVSTRFSTS